MQKLEPILPLSIFLLSIALWLSIEAGATVAALGKARSMPQLYTTAATFDDISSQLLEQADAVVVARVRAAESNWNEDHTIIQTRYTFELLENLLELSGAERAFSLSKGTTFQVVIDGGFLDHEGLGLWVSHEATFAPEETVLLFLQTDVSAKRAMWNRQDQTIARETWQIVGAELGKYTVDSDVVTNEAIGINHSWTEFLQAFDTQLSSELHENWSLGQGNNAGSHPISPHGDPPRWLQSGLELLVKVNVNSVQITEVTTAGDLFMAIQRAMRAWSLIPSADFTILYDGETSVKTTGYNGENEIVFMPQGANKPLGQAQIWYTAENVILEVDMWLNDDYKFSVADEPTINEIDLESVVLHEIGHWVPLGHSSNPAAVMYSVLGTTEVKRELHADDINALMALYPCDLVPCVHEYYQGEVPTPTPAVTPSPVPTITPTPTLVPTQPPPTGVDIVYLPYVVR